MDNSLSLEIKGSEFEYGAFAIYDFLSFFLFCFHDL